jgi:hypothetical protein
MDRRLAAWIVVSVVSSMQATRQRPDVGKALPRRETP